MLVLLKALFVVMSDLFVMSVYKHTESGLILKLALKCGVL